MNIAQIFQFVSMLAWLLAIGLGVAAVTRASRGQGAKGLGTSVLAVIVVALVLTVAGAGMVFIQPEERGVVISALDPKGYRAEALQPGLRWIVPFAEQVRTYKISRQTYTMSAATSEGQISGDDSIRARTNDGQEVFIDASVIFQIDAGRVIDLHINWQSRYQDELVRPATRGIIRDIASQYGVEEIVSTKRVELEELITTAIEEKFAENDLILVDFVLRDIHFSTEYAAAVEQKQIAEQEAQRAQFVVESKKQEAEQARQIAQGAADAAVIAAKGQAEARIIEATAEAEALNLIAAALQDNPDLLTYQYINKLTPNIDVMLLPSDSPFLFPLPGTQTDVEIPQ